MIYFLDLKEDLKFFDKKILKFILDNKSFDNKEKILFNIMEIKDCINRYSNNELEEILDDFLNIRIKYKIIDELKNEYKGNFVVSNSYKIINDESVEFEFSSDFLNTFKPEHYLYELKLSLFFSFSFSYSIILYNFLASKLQNLNYIKIGINELKDTLNLKTNYNRLYDFEKYVLLPSINEINQISNKKFFYNKIKRNNKLNGKISTLEFFTINEDKLNQINLILGSFSEIKNYELLFHKILYCLNTVSYESLSVILNDMKKRNNEKNFEEYFLSKIEEKVSEYNENYLLIYSVNNVKSFNQYKSLILTNAYIVDNSFLFLWSSISSIKKGQPFEYESDIMKITAKYYDGGDKFIKIYQKKR